MIIGALTVAYLLIVWFKSQAFSEYAGLTIKSATWFKIKEYQEYREFSGFKRQPSYPQFLVETYPSFFTRLLSCETCCSFWLALAFTVAFLPISQVFAVAFVGLCSYHLYLKLVKNDQRDIN
ncbi:MAG: hypothetical protein EBU46_00750 [Nitrosomonadaceae bacterium]|nr:hypothetical protein [Nitrosomonadaceae bacterium]